MINHSDYLYLLIVNINKLPLLGWTFINLLVITHFNVFYFRKYIFTVFAGHFSQFSLFGFQQMLKSGLGGIILEVNKNERLLSFATVETITTCFPKHS